MNRKNISSGAPWESIVGYSRAVVVGDWVEVTGTVAVGEDGKVVGTNDMYRQTQFALEKIGKVLAEAGSSLQNVVRTRIYVTDIDQWEAVGKAHAEVFGEIRPATTMVEVSRLISPEYLVEIEARAYIK
ncbi:MAG: RidA family protein [Bacteroidota bacterium]